MKYLRIAMLSIMTIAQSMLSAGEGSTAPAEIQSLQAQGLADLHDIVDKAMAIFQVPGASISVVVDGKLVFAKGYGFRDLENKLPVTPETLFAIGSCTKAFTRFAIGILIDEGLLDWNDKVIEHLPEISLMNEHATKNMTIKDLVTHRSGLPRRDFVWYHSSFTHNDLLERLKYLEFANDLREEFHYSNLMYTIAGLVVERVTGENWETLLQQRIFYPLGMDRSNFSVEDSKKDDNIALPYTDRRGVVQKIPFRNLSNIGPPGSIKSNVIDMSKWLQLQLSKGSLFSHQFIQEATLKEMHRLQFAKAEFPRARNYLIGYGLGWFISIYRGYYLIDHGGGIDGFTAHTSLLPQIDAGIIVLCNHSGLPDTKGGSFFVKSVSRTIIDRLLGLEQIDWIEQFASEQKGDHSDFDKPNPKLIPSNIQEYIGNYEHLGYGTITVFSHNGQLVSEFNGILTSLTYKCNDVFLGSDESADPIFANLPFNFQSDEWGNITALHMTIDIIPIAFEKK